ACHAIDVMNFIVGTPTAVDGVVRQSVFSSDVDDEVYCTLRFADGSSGQLSVNWSDDSQRKMSTRVSVWGTRGRLVVDRQECQLFLRDGSSVDVGFRKGWQVRNTTELTENVWFYLRGEEYSTQIDYFAESILQCRMDGENTFRSALETDRIVSMIAAYAAVSTPVSDSPRGSRTFWSRFKR
ncbi:MAG: Gfo/Idh/MocA family oxidoreductase, partial [bacterium]